MTQEAAVEIVRLRREIERRVAEMCEMRTEIERLRAALQGIIAEWDKLSRYGSPIAKAANEQVRAARAALEGKP